MPWKSVRCSSSQKEKLSKQFLSFEFWGLFLTIIDLTFMSLLSHNIKPQRRHFDFAGTLLEDRIWHLTQLFLYFLLHQNSLGKNKRILGILAWGIQEGDSMICNYPARSRIYKIKIFLFLCNNGWALDNSAVIRLYWALGPKCPIGELAACKLDEIIFPRAAAINSVWKSLQKSHFSVVASFLTRVEITTKVSNSKLQLR